MNLNDVLIGMINIQRMEINHLPRWYFIITGSDTASFGLGCYTSEVL